MVCAKCGCDQDAMAQFCRQCGSQMEAAAAAQPVFAGGPPPAYVPGLVYVPRARVRQHLQPLGILWCIYGAYRLVALVIASFVLKTMASGGMFGEMPDAVSQMLRALVPAILVITVMLAAAAMVTGYALLTRKPWARIVAIILGILALLKLPFGTALGIYTLWVLAPQASGAEWDAMTGPAE